MSHPCQTCSSWRALAPASTPKAPGARSLCRDYLHAVSGFETCISCLMVCLALKHA